MGGADGGGGGGGGAVGAVGAAAAGFAAAVTTMKKNPNPNPVEQLAARVRGMEGGFRAWLARQPMPVEAAVATAAGAAQGAAIGGLMGTLTADALPSPVPPQAMPSFNQAQLEIQCQIPSPLSNRKAFAGGPLVQARNFAVMTGVNAGISCVLRRIRGVEDVQSSMAAAFGSGALFSLVSGMGAPNPVANAVTSGLAFAIFQGGFFMVGQKFSQPPADDVHYSRTKSMLTSLGLQNYEKNFKKGLLTDHTLSLLTDSALSDVKIPPGPRLLILDHIQRAISETATEAQTV
ncbi:mitochondrial import inner membrane translocase subunit TIM22-like isoform X2 [Ananas comosus]|uniref:Mitochondrial import inner membrane translocase subunit TIM22-like isoform X2 n=1 Tax=Ananas comosus TaxID=4615 RepID=A0A6P5GFU3_ANACO|nr:mitochondrial import inner membrane translocase subunit TIM22-like isoform X2 [Ananas comosus]